MSSLADSLDSQRVWFLPLAWITKSIEAKKLVPEEDYDFEKLEHVRRQDRAEVLSEERRQHGGKSIYARGERAILERQRKEVRARTRLIGMRVPRPRRLMRVRVALWSLTARARPPARTRKRSR